MSLRSLALQQNRKILGKGAKAGVGVRGKGQGVRGKGLYGTMELVMEKLMSFWSLVLQKNRKILGKGAKAGVGVRGKVQGLGGKGLQGIIKWSWISLVTLDMQNYSKKGENQEILRKVVEKNEKKKKKVTYRATLRELKNMSLKNFTTVKLKF